MCCTDRSEGLTQASVGQNARRASESSLGLNGRPVGGGESGEEGAGGEAEKLDGNHVGLCKRVWVCKERIGDKEGR